MYSSPPKFRPLVASGPVPRLGGKGEQQQLKTEEAAAEATQPETEQQQAGQEEQQQQEEAQPQKEEDAAKESPPQQTRERSSPAPQQQQQQQKKMPLVLPPRATSTSRSRSGAAATPRGSSPSPRNPTPSRRLTELQTQRTPKIGAFRVSQPRDIESQKSERAFLKKDDRTTNSELWWHSLAAPRKAFKPQTNPIPANTTRRIDNKSKEDNIWQHLYESGQDGEKRKLFHATEESFRYMSKMWEGGFKTHGSENRREVTVPGMQQKKPWDRNARSDKNSTNEPKRTKKELDDHNNLQRLSSGLSRNGGYDVEPAANSNPNSRNRRALSHEPAQQNRSPWYQKSEAENRRASSRYLLSSSRHLTENAGRSGGGGGGSSSNRANTSRSGRGDGEKSVVVVG